MFNPFPKRLQQDCNVDAIKEHERRRLKEGIAEDVLSLLEVPYAVLVNVSAIETKEIHRNKYHYHD